MDYNGNWALITGASAGIGAAFARSLAAKGANVILTARREHRLQALALELRDKYGIETQVYVADFTDPQAPEMVMGAIAEAGHPVDVLVNNAGWGLPGRYLDNAWSDYRDYLELMVTSYAHLAHRVLPGMIDRGYGRIIQISSVAGLVPGSAGHTLYGASKGFLVAFSQSLAAECEGTGVKVSAVCPGFTYSEFHDVNGARDLVSQLPKYMFMEADPVVEGALAHTERGHVVYVPGIWNKFLVWLAKALPRPWASSVMRAQSQRARSQSAKA